MENVILRASATKLGLPHYFTGKPCKYGHIVGRRTTNGRCLECERLSVKDWQKNNPQIVKKLKAQFHVANREKRIAQAKDWRAKNKEKVIEYRQLTREKSIAYASNYKKVNKEKINNYFESYRNNNKDKRVAWENKRRAAKNASLGQHTSDDIKALFVLQKAKCASCHCDISKSYHVDHITPLSKGGSNDYKNLQLLCPPCNLKKHNKDGIQWANLNGKLL